MKPGFCIVFIATLSYLPVLADDPALQLGTRPPVTAARDDMHAAYDAFKTLYRYLFSASEFEAPEHQKEISAALDTFSQRFNHVASEGLSNEPGFRTSLRLAIELIEDARKNYREGNLEFARWRLRSLGNYCLTCHTRAKVELDYTASDPGLSQLSPLELGEFYLASHQFQASREIFVRAAKTSKNSSERMQALRNWLILIARIDQNPQHALSELNQIRRNAKLSASETQEVAAWTDSLRRWINEGAKQKSSALEIAKHLTTIGTNLAATDYPGGGAVELLRATGILHAALINENLDLSDRANALLLLGIAYSHLPQFFVDELPESFYEQAIRGQPNSSTAQKAFEGYKETVELGFTGSGGTNLPPEVAKKITELRTLAYGSPAVKQVPAGQAPHS